MNYEKTCIRILSDLPQKHKEVVLRRFGLENGKRETLESIGQDFGVTRERVRQIEANTLERLEHRKPELKDIFTDFNKYLKSNGGLKREDIILADLGGRNTNPVYFLLTLGNDFYHVSETQDNYAFWTIEDNIRKYSLQDYAVPVRGLPVSFEDQMKSLTDARENIEGFIRVSRELVADGA